MSFARAWVGIDSTVRPIRHSSGVKGAGTRRSGIFGDKGGVTRERTTGHVGVVTSEGRAGVLGTRAGRDMVPVPAIPTSSPPSTTSRPSLWPHVVIVVEGINDARNVRRYLDVDIYVLGSATKTGTSATREELRDIQSRYRRIVLLLDPDVAGRQARNDIDRLLDGNKVRVGRLGCFVAGCNTERGLTVSCIIVACFQCWHAFIPTSSAMLGRETKYKGVGDVGVEHASGEAVRQAILRSRLSRTGKAAAGDMEVGGELPFNRGILMELGLVAEMGVRGKDVTRRRELVCAWLGIGVCDGKQLLRQLNTYGFTPAELSEALAYAADNLGHF